MAVDSRTSADQRPNHRHTGPTAIRAGLPLVAVAVAIAGLMWLVGSLLVDGSAPGVLGRADTQTAQWAVATGHRGWTR